MIESRLLQILFILLEQGSTTAPELAEKFEVSTRTIYRDIDALSAAGIPVYAIRGKGGGLFIRESYVLDKALFSEDEQKEILLAVQNLNLTNGGRSRGLLSKINGLFETKSHQWLEIDFSDWTGLRDGLFEALQEAVIAKKVIQIQYLNAQGGFSQRKLEPLKLVFRDKAWYLYAFCRLREAERLFKVARMRNVQRSDETFTRETPEKVFAEPMTSVQKRVQLTLLFDSSVSYRVLEEFKEVLHTEDGHLEVLVSLPEDDSTLDYLLSFGDQVEILKPPGLRERMVQRIENMGKKYRT